MTHFTKVCMLMLMSSTMMFGQTTIKKSATVSIPEEQNVSSSYPIPGSDRLAKRWKVEREKLSASGVRLSVPSLKKSSSFGFTVGAQRSWYATDMSGSSEYEYSVPSTCRAVGTNCYVFAEDASWNTYITQAAVDSIVKAFEVRTPANTSKGIFQLDTMYFGTPPDVDGDSKIVILILDIKDGYSGSGGYIAGYFYGINEYSDREVQSELGSNRHSNEAEIYYIDCNPANLTTSNGIAGVAGTTAHEFQHMIHWKYDGDEISFVNEGCAEAASALCGYGLRSPSLYYANTNVPFLDWGESSENVLPEYSRAAIFTWYLIEQFGSSLTRYIVQETTNGEEGYNRAFQSIGSSLQFSDVIKDFSVATRLNRKDYNSKYGFDYQILVKPADHHTLTSPNASIVNDTLKPYGTTYLTYINGTSLSVNFSSSSNISVRAIATGTSSVSVTDVPLGQTYSVDGFGSLYSSVTFAVINGTQSNVLYSLSSSGTGGTSALELKYDDTEPIGYLQLSAGDTVCVWFQGVSGMKLDSIRVALRRAGSVRGGVWRFNSASQTPLGAPLAVPITASVTQTPGFPYPVPWPNWGSIDLRSYNIDASNPFAVAFLVEGSSTEGERIMVTSAPDPGTYTSLTYLSDYGGWYFLTSDYNSEDEKDSVWNYVIRAYVSSANGVEEQPVELLPERMYLSQNFPNPFNPSTAFHYILPAEDYITLKLYDMLGREVATIFEGISKQENTIYWTTQNLPSGTYFYRLYSRFGTQVKKLVLLK
ncbi:MAG TPA: T9SS type A sorting domain-containing protein [Bacteroidota bacterium]|nr:T9SS type A sorting domain-containing protein [Bacteroidota bacterium]